MKLAIATISNRDDKPQFRRSMMRLVTYLHKEGASFGVSAFSEHHIPNCSMLCAGRQIVLDQAIKKGFSHLLCIDNDTEFDPQVLRIMMERKVQAIAPNFTIKNPDKLLFTARAIDENHPQLRGNRIDSRDKTGIQEVYEVGFGMFLLDLSAMANIPAPHFEMIWKPDEYYSLYQPEDYYFVKKLRAHGIPVYVDHDASQLVKHVGDYSYDLYSYPGIEAEL